MVVIVTERSIKVIALTILFGNILQGCRQLAINQAEVAFETKPNGRIDKFTQSNTGNCFYLAALIALSQDREGQAKIKTSIIATESSEVWHISFPNIPDRTVSVSMKELSRYRLKNSAGDGWSFPVTEDPDVALLEIAADKLWRQTIKEDGLWDDVPMNALYMFTHDPQYLIWNRSKASKKAQSDIDKYRRLPKGFVTEIPILSQEQTRKALASFVRKDSDGLSMIKIDYDHYHAVVIYDVDLAHNLYRTIDTTFEEKVDNDLFELVEGIANGKYAINYVEVR